MTVGLVIVNVVIFLLTSQQSRTGIEWQNRLVAFGPAVDQCSGFPGPCGQWYRLITAGFVHFDVLHILFNMVIIYRFGAMLEPALGKTRYLVLYLATLLAGSFGAMLLTPDARTGGASGAALGLVAAAGVGLHHRGVNLWQSGIGPLLVINLLLSFRPGISLGGHVGGAVAGALVGWFMLRLPSGTPRRTAMIEGLAVGLAVAGASLVGGLWAAGRI
jgi:membrane associated rhomboid family serine protease